VSEPQQRREEIVDRLTDHVLAAGLEAASLRPLARAIGTSDRMLLYYFTDKAELMAAVLGCAAARLTVRLEAAAPGDARLAEDRLQAVLLDALRAAELAPYMQLWLEIVGRAARQEQPFRAIGEAIGRGFLAWVEARLDIDDPARRQQAATRVLAQVEGLVLLGALGLAEI